MNIHELKEKFDYLYSDKKKWSLEDLYIVAPYPTSDFFSIFLESFRPTNKLYLFVDDGWPTNRIEDIKSEIEKKKIKSDIFRISAEDGGFVHAKIYFFRWKSDANTYMRHLLIGSANASSYGFGSHAETYALIWRGDLDAPEDKKSFPLESSYFRKLIENGQCEQCDASFGSGSWISLPALKIVQESDDDYAPTFDSWLRRGYLYHKFDPSSNFGKVVLQAKESFSDSKAMNAFANADLNDLSLTTQISYPYLKSTNDKGKNKTHWKANYFTETIYGHWVSKGCYIALGDTFKSGDTLTKESNIASLKSGGLFQDEVSEMIRRLERVIQLLGPESSRYLEVKNGRCNSSFYEKLARTKINIDRNLANDSRFEKRYINGYSHTQTPSMSEADFEDFALSFCEDIIFEAGKPKTQSKIAAKIRNSISKNRIYNEHQLLEDLRRRWSSYRNTLLEYWI